MGDKITREAKRLAQLEKILTFTYDLDFKLPNNSIFIILIKNYIFPGYFFTNSQSIYVSKQITVVLELSFPTTTAERLIVANFTPTAQF